MRMVQFHGNYKSRFSKHFEKYLTFRKPCEKVTGYITELFLLLRK